MRKGNGKNGTMVGKGRGIPKEKKKNILQEESGGGKRKGTFIRPLLRRKRCYWRERALFFKQRKEELKREGQTEGESFHGSMHGDREKKNIG